MSDDEIPLEIRPLKGVRVIESPEGVNQHQHDTMLSFQEEEKVRPVIPCELSKLSADEVHDHPSVEPQIVYPADPSAPSAAGSLDTPIFEALDTPATTTTLPGASETAMKPADEIPFLLPPTSSVKPIDSAPTRNIDVASAESHEHEHRYSTPKESSSVDEIPFLLSPTTPVRLIDNVPADTIDSAPTDCIGREQGHFLAAKRPAPSYIGWTAVLITLALLVIWMVQGFLNWAGQFTNTHPTLGTIVHGLLGILAIIVVVWVGRQYRAYRRLDLLGDFQMRLECARDLHVTRNDDIKLRHDFQARLEKLQATRLIAPMLRESVLTVMASRSEPGEWVGAASSRLLRDMDERVKAIIEQEARRVGVMTALSPSGPLDTGIVLWRNARLALRIAEIYAVRPGGYGNYRLLRRVVTNMATAGLSQEVMQMLYAAYGPAAVEAASKGFRSFFDVVGKGGMLLATVEPLTGSLLAASGAVGKGVSDFAGTAAAQITGPLLQGVLNAILTIRIGLAAQNECRLVSLRPEERRALSAGIVSSMLGFFLNVRRTPIAPTGSEPISGG